MGVRMLRMIVPAGVCLAMACGVARSDQTARQVLRALRLTSPLTIDGDAGDWPKAAPRAKMALDPDSDDYRGAARAAWDAEFLYVVFEVASGKPLRNAGDDPATAFKTGDKLLFNLAINFSNRSGTANIGKAYWNGPSHMTEDVGIEAQIHPEQWGWLELRAP